MQILIFYVHTCITALMLYLDIDQGNFDGKALAHCCQQFILNQEIVGSVSMIEASIMKLNINCESRTLAINKWLYFSIFVDNMRFMYCSSFSFSLKHLQMAIEPSFRGVNGVLNEYARAMGSSCCFCFSIWYESFTFAEIFNITDCAPAGILTWLGYIINSTGL